MGTATGNNVQDSVSRLRELDHRRHDGIDVSLLWDATANAVFVSVIDERGGASFRIQPPPSQALDAFRHPFVYAPLAEETGGLLAA